jgi:hypothetical protein
VGPAGSVPFTILSNTMLTFTVPGGTSGVVYDIVITTPNQASGCTTTYEFRLVGAFIPL